MGLGRSYILQKELLKRGGVCRLLLMLLTLILWNDRGKNHVGSMAEKGTEIREDVSVRPVS